MGQQLFANNASSTIAGGTLDPAGTSITLATGTGSKFPSIVSGSGDYYYCTLENTARTLTEVVKVTARSGDVLTVVRGQDGTTGAAFFENDYIELRLTRQSLIDLSTDTHQGNNNPLVNGTATPGTSVNFSREDHVHPKDPTKVSLTGVETLTNKTIAAPTLVAPVLGTPASGNLVNCTFPILNQNTTGTAASCTGNAGSATRLLNPRTINGVTFDGTANITIPNQYTLTIGSYLNGSSYNGGSATTISVKATATNVANQIVARDANGNFAAGTITATLNGSAASCSGNASTATVALSCIGNSVTATSASQLSGDHTNWKTYRSSSVANMLGWNNNGNGSVIFDASKSLSPANGAVDRTNAASPWTAGRPVLMGWNGSTTVGVRVDSARTADIATSVNGTTVTGTVGTFSSNVSVSGILNAQHIWATSGSARLSMDTQGLSGYGIKKITCNDGLGNWNLRGGVYASGGALLYETTGNGGTSIVQNFEATHGALHFYTYPTGTAGVGVSSGPSMSLTSTGLTVSGNTAVTGSLTVGGSAVVTSSNLASLTRGKTWINFAMTNGVTYTNTYGKDIIVYLRWYNPYAVLGYYNVVYVDGFEATLNGTSVYNYYTSTYVLVPAGSTWRWTSNGYQYLQINRICI